ncbi:MAG: CBS domain-containing protein [Coriobacteriia bacterium]|nr:CBS domain-containing protein [Coriobacteriia bacterium]
MGLLARDIMTTDLVTVSEDMPVREAAKLMAERGIGALLVLRDGRLAGIVTEGDLIMQDVKVQFPTYIHLLDGFIMYPPAAARFETELKKAVGATVGDVMTRKVVTVSVDTPVEDVATLMVDRDVSRVPVMDEDAVVGIISKSDIVRSLAAEG